MCMYHACARSGDGGGGGAATGAIDGRELPCGFWESNLGPLEEQPTLLTAEPFLQPPETSNVIC